MQSAVQGLCLNSQSPLQHWLDHCPRTARDKDAVVKCEVIGKPLWGCQGCGSRRGWDPEHFLLGSLLLICIYTQLKNFRSAPDFPSVKEKRATDAIVSFYRCF